jgi:hypothetical protein
MKKRTLLIILISLITTFSFGVNIFAASPSKALGFQGQLFNNNAPLTGSVNATFTFYDSLSGGAVTGSPISKTVTVANGYFGAQFTEADTTGVNFDQALYIQVNINGTDLSPRTALNAAPTALKSFGTFSYSAAPAIGPAGSLYFNTTNNTLYISNGTAWASSTPWATGGPNPSISYMGGLVGVGTSDPLMQFTVFSPYAATSTIASFQGNSNSTAQVGSIQGPKSGTIQIVGSDDNQNHGGSLLISTFSVGAFSARSSSIYFTGSRSTAAEYNAGLFNAMKDGDQIGALTFGGDNGVNLRSQGATIMGKASGDWATTSTAGYLAFSTTPSSSTTLFERVRITSDGSLGIGTTTPLAVLSVKGKSTGTGALAQFTDSANVARVTFLDNGNVGIGTSTPAGQFDISQGAPSGLNKFVVDLAAGANTNRTLKINRPTQNAVGLQVSVSSDGSMGTTTNLILQAGGGYVGIGTSTPTANLHASGTIRFSSFGAGTLSTDASGNVTVSSDERLKDIQGEFKSGLDKILGLTPIVYKWKPETGYDTTNAYAGFSAQNVQSVIPEAVGMDERGYLTLADRPILATLVNAVKELATKVEKMAAWFTDSTTFTVKQDSKLNVEGQVCSDEICISKDQFKNLLRIAAQNGGGFNVYIQTPTPVQSSQPEPSAGTSTPSEPAVDPEPVVVPEPTIPEPVPLSPTPETPSVPVSE